MKINMEAIDDTVNFINKTTMEVDTLYQELSANFTLELSDQVQIKAALVIKTINALNKYFEVGNFAFFNDEAGFEKVSSIQAQLLLTTNEINKTVADTELLISSQRLPSNNTGFFERPHCKM